MVFYGEIWYIVKKERVINKSMRILIIEDDMVDCNNFINSAKNRKDVEIIGITDSDIEGLKYVKSKHPDGIVLDLELNNSTSGNTDSLEFLSELKALNLDYEPIIIVTTHINSKRVYNILHRDGADIILYKNHPKYSADYVLNKFMSLREVSPQKTVEILKSELKDNEQKISDCISRELDLIGIPSKIVGRKYIHDAILYLIKNKENNINVIRYLTSVYKKSGNTITNGIQNAIIHAWNKTAVDDLLEYYRARVNPETGIPTPMEFIYYYVEKIEKEI